jgi:N-acetylmuramoyl-L-alanine amidase
MKQENNQKLSVVSNDSKDLELIARLVNGESLNQTLEGKIAVANTVINRVHSPLFPNTVRDVIYAPGQFHPVGGKRFNSEPHKDSKLAALIALAGVNIVPDALYFHNKSISNQNWVNTLEPYEIATIDEHTFARQPKTQINYEKGTILIGTADSVIYELQLQAP